MFAVEPTAFVPGRDLHVSGSGARRGGWVRLPVALVVAVALALAADAVLYCLLLEISTFTFRHIALHGAYRSLLWLDASLFVGVARLIWYFERRSVAQAERSIRAAFSRLEGAPMNRRNSVSTVLHGDPVPRSRRYISSTLMAVKQ